MSWAWLTGSPVLLVVFISAVLGIPASVITVVPVLRRPIPRHAEKTAVKSETPAVEMASNVFTPPDTGRPVNPYEYVPGYRPWSPPPTPDGWDDDQWASYSWGMMKLGYNSP
jgi:hypothetical protein